MCLCVICLWFQLTDYELWWFLNFFRDCSLSIKYFEFNPMSVLTNKFDDSKGIDEKSLIP